jgi:hypothetical protein
MMHWRLLVVAILLLPDAPVLRAQDSPVTASEVTAFLGTWVFTMTNPRGATETVRIWEKNGTVAASVQAGRFPPIAVSGILKDGDMLVLTLKRFENGKPIRAISSTPPPGACSRNVVSRAILPGRGRSSSRTWRPARRSRSACYEMQLRTMR